MLFSLIIYPIYLLIECIFTFFMRFSANVGCSVIGISVGITFLCLPLYAVAEHWQRIERDKQKSMGKWLSRIKATFKGDERYMMTMAFYREQHYNPIMALRSSFGLLIQIPFFIAAYSFLSHLPELHGRSFLFIRDMGAPDALFSIGSFSINALPVIMTAINIISGLIYTKGFTLKEKLQPLVLALLFLLILYRSPSGLVLYWTCNNIFSLIKNIFYKLKHPLAAFWVCACAALIPVSAKIICFTTIKPKYKAIYMLTVLVVFFLPALMTLTKKLLFGFLAPLVKDSRTRATLYFCSCAVLFLLLGLATPSTLIADSPVEFSDIGNHPNPLFYILNTALQAFGIFGFWATAIYFLFNAHVQTVLCLVMASLAAGSVCNSYVFMLTYGDLSSSLVFLNANTDFQTVSAVSALNVAVLGIVIVLVLALSVFRRGKLLVSAQVTVSLTFIALSALNVSAIKTAYANYVASKSTDSAVSIEPIFHLSKTKPNIVVLMLDCAHGGYIPEVFNEAPELKDVYSGFTFYLNTLSFNGHTIQGAPGIFGGYEYTPLEMNRRSEKPLVEKHNEALLMLPRLLSENGFSATITDPSFANYSDYMDLTILDAYPEITGRKLYGTYSALWNQQNGNKSGIDNTETLLKRNLFFFSIFRASPIAIREMIYIDGLYWNPNSEINRTQETIGWYSELDYLPELTDFSSGDRPTYTAIVNEFTHTNLLLQAPDYVPVSTVTDYGTSAYKKEGGYHVAISSLKRVGEWLTYLKAHGAYDNTRIIIVSDHGKGALMYFDENKALDDAIHGTLYRGRGHFHPILFFKDFNAAGQIAFDTTTFMTNADVPSLVLGGGLLEEPVNPFTHKEIPLHTEKIKADGVIVSANDKHVPFDHGKYRFSIKNDEWWLVKDNIFKSENWTRAHPFQ